MKKVLKYGVMVLLYTVSYDAPAQPLAFAASQADSLLLKGNKDVFMFVYTDWCRYCAAMKQTTFKEDSLARLLNTHFYFVPFNAGSREPITLLGTIYRYIPTGAGTGVHQLAQALAGGSAPAYPLMAVVNPSGQILFSHSSYLNAAQLAAVLNRLLQMDDSAAEAATKEIQLRSKHKPNSKPAVKNN